MLPLVHHRCRLAEVDANAEQQVMAAVIVVARGRTGQRAHELIIERADVKVLGETVAGFTERERDARDALLLEGRGLVVEDRRRAGRESRRTAGLHVVPLGPTAAETAGDVWVDAALLAEVIKQVAHDADNGLITRRAGAGEVVDGRLAVIQFQFGAQTGLPLVAERALEDVTDIESHFVRRRHEGRRRVMFASCGRWKPPPKLK